MSFDPRPYQPADETGAPVGHQPVAGGLLSLLLRNPKLLAALGLVVFAVIGYMGKPEKVNALSGKTYKYQLQPEQEVALGLQSVPEMTRQFGGEVRDPRLLNKINQIGERLLAAKESLLEKRVRAGRITPKQVQELAYPFTFHVLQDNETINAFALPGGQVFITMALLRQLPNEDAVAGVLGHEIGHVLAQHSNRQMVKSGLLSGIVNGAAILTSDGRSNSSQIAQYVGQVVSTKYGREDESESDRIGVQLMIEAGYDPKELLSVMEVLKKSMQGPRPPEMLSTHPFPETRARQIEEDIEYFQKNGAAADAP